jgi:DNA uptake protein ComE-like DNA-binding protein
MINSPGGDTMKKITATVLATIFALTFSTIVFAADANVRLIDINTATEAQLKAIPGVGDEYAKKIIAARPYNKKEELTTKKIIPADSYEKIKKLIDAVC